MNRIASAFALILMSCTAVSEPELLKGLPTDFRAGEQESNRRAKSMFPIGTPDSAIISQLSRQGFELLPLERDEHGPWADATFVRKEFIFRTIWSIRWRSRHGRVTELWAVYGQQGP